MVEKCVRTVRFHLFICCSCVKICLCFSSSVLPSICPQQKQQELKTGRFFYILKRTSVVCIKKLDSGTSIRFWNQFSGSLKCWSSRIRIRQSKIRIRILPSAKIVRKPLISTVLWLLYDFLSVKNDVTISSKSKTWHLEGHWRKEQDPEPDHYWLERRIFTWKQFSPWFSPVSNKTVLWIHDILVWIRIRGSVPLKIVLDPNPAIFILDLQDANENYFFAMFFCLSLFERAFTYIIVPR